MRSISWLVLSLAATAFVFSCGGDDSNNTVDAPPTIDSPPAIDSPPPADAPPPDAASNSVTCGAETCDTATQDCCLDNTSGNLNCVPSGTCGMITITCDGPEDCGSATDECCASDAGAACAPPGGGMCDAQLCHVPGDCPNPGDMCCPLGTTGISACFAGACPG